MSTNSIQIRTTAKDFLEEADLATFRATLAQTEGTVSLFGTRTVVFNSIVIDGRQTSANLNTISKIFLERVETLFENEQEIASKIQNRIITLYEQSDVAITKANWFTRLLAFIWDLGLFTSNPRKLIEESLQGDETNPISSHNLTVYSKKITILPDDIPAFLHAIKNPDYGKKIQRLEISSDKDTLSLGPEIAPSSGLLTDQDVENIIKYCPNLKELEFYRCFNFTEKGFRQINLLTKLRHLSLSCCTPCVTDKMVEHIVKLGTQLHALDLLNCDRITNASLKMIGNNLSYLRRLNVENCHQLDDTGFTSILSLEDLYEIKARGCYKITEQTYCNSTVQSEFCGMRPEHIQAIKLQRRVAFETVEITKENLSSFLQSLDTKKEKGEKIYNLFITSCPLTDQDVEKIITTCPEVIHLKLEGCSNLTENCLNNIGSLYQLKYLSLANCQAVTNKTLKFLKPWELRSLNLKGCNKLTNNALTRIAQQNPYLESLDISNCPKLTDKGLDSLLNLDWLKKLNITGCQKLTDKKFNRFYDGTIVIDKEGVKRTIKNPGRIRRQRLASITIRE